MQAIVMAAGRGTRMKSEKPKLLHTVGGKTLIGHVVTRLKDIGIDSPIVVVGHEREQVSQAAFSANPHVRFALHDFSKESGTGAAVRVALDQLDPSLFTYIASGDAPFFSIETFRALSRFMEDPKTVFAITTALFDEPFPPYGRIIRNEDSGIEAIVEEKNATEQQRQIREMNVGCYIAKTDWLIETAKQLLPNEVTGEYYVTDLVDLARQDGYQVAGHQLRDSRESIGINTLEDLALAEKIWENFSKTNLTLTT